MSKTTVILPAGRPTFHRTVRKDGQTVLDEAGNARVLEFQPGQPVELSGDELEAVRDDIGPALQIAKVADAKPVAKADGKATDKFVADTKKLRAEQLAAAAKEKDARADQVAMLREAITAPLAPAAKRPVAHASRDHETKGK